MKLGKISLTALTEDSDIAGDIPDMCRCSECGKTFKIADCEKDYGHHDGWEMAPYTEILCPECEDGGCIDDFFYSPENLPDKYKE